MLNALLVLGYAAVQICALVFAFRAIQITRTSQGAAAWVVFLVALPLVAVPAYLFLGSWRIGGYVVARREVKDVAHAICSHAKLNRPNESALDDSIHAFEAIAGLPVAAGNHVSLLIDGPATFEAIFAALDRAQDYVLVQFYIVSDDELGRAFRDRLIACAKRGVRVRFLFDRVGSHKLPKAYLEALEEAGVKTINVHAQTGPHSRFQINFRNHRKTVVVDGTCGFTGGLNVGDEYMSRDTYFGHWRDTHCQLEGPMVSQLQLVFAEDWFWATGEDLRDMVNWTAPQMPQNTNGVIVATGPADPHEYGALFFCAAIHAARKRLWIATPYMVPENDVLAALKLAALRGVEVRLLVPDKVDHWLPWLAAMAYFDELRAVGVEIWRYNQGFMHQKVVLIDDQIAAVGTANLDNRSFRLNFESTAVLFDRAFAGEVTQMLEADFKDAFLLEQSLGARPLWIRICAPIARLFSPLL
ncbi:cardiolipin synthase [Tritonibacter mobilis]|uniref:Cardiolipin synthase n=1 Tax=Tritonibacter mobilis F1926 TaxID=1265309 RepID=A0A1B1A9X9_9RHOB|nr:cardiolipin synthase [Tritonibacter mobilis]ANP43359.1 cardiolipin synthase [Tritonibacter mobilis F1926]KJZ24672.1 cardiolipin synthase [Tritonibacter mobilis]